jgi:GWxTD domain-containing protein
MAALLLLALLCPAQQSREFDALALNQRSAKGNTMLLVLPQTGLRGVDEKTGEVVAQLRVTATVRNAATQAVVAEVMRDENIRQGFTSATDPFLLSYPLTLNPGRYQVEVEVRDRRTGAVHFSSFAHEARDLTLLPNLADLTIAQGFAGAEVPLQPLLGTQLVPFPEAQLHFGCEVYGTPGTTLTLRAVLYRQSSPEPGEPAAFDYGRVETYSSLQQFNSILKVGADGRVRFEQTLPVDPLDEGEYQLEVSLFVAEQRIAETGRSFSIPWKGLREIFSRLDEAIDRMGYVAPAEWMASLKAESNPGLKQERFLRFWTQRAGSQEGGLKEMRQYYERVFFADHLFAEGEKPGWSTDRGRVYCLYGPPDKKEQITQQGKEMEVWSYLPRNLRMVFFVEGDTYHWVKPYHD